MEFRIGRKKGDQSTMRAVRYPNGEKYGVFGTVKDLYDRHILVGDYHEVEDKWLLIIGFDDDPIVRQFDDRASVKKYLEELK